MAESIDPVSGSGAVPPRNDPKGIGKKTVTPVEKVFNQPVKGQPYRSAIGQAISQKDLENMTQQIQIARKLGDSVMEMEDTPPEVMKALDQAAQKNGYKNWADVKANPRSNSAVMTVAKLASTIMKTTPPHHAEKLFYKNKTDVAEGYARKLNFDEIYGKYLKVTDNDGDPNKEGFSLVTPLNGDSWNWRERPEFKDIVKRK